MLLVLCSLKPVVAARGFRIPGILTSKIQTPLFWSLMRTEPRLRKRVPRRTDDSPLAMRFV